MRSRHYLFSENLISRIAQLLSSPQKHLKLSRITSRLVHNENTDKILVALKFFRSCIGLQDESYHSHFIQHNHFSPILNIVYSTMPRDNLLNSACLELFEFIRHVNTKPIVEHLVMTHRERFKEITYVDTFQNLILRYENTNQQPPQDGDMTLFSNDGGTPDARRSILNGNRWQSMKEMDATEQAYFDTSDDEEDEDHNNLRTKKVKSSGASLTNGLASSPMLKSLVDYPDDDDDALESLPSQSLPNSSQPKLSPSPMLQTPPPERLSEKRRREDDDDEDELGKLSTTTKRRNSSSSIPSSGGDTSPNNNPLRRKKGVIAFKDRDSQITEKDHGEAKRKISISLSGSGVKTPPAQTNVESKDDDSGKRG